VRLGLARRTSLVFLCSITLLAVFGSSAQAAFPGRNGRIAFERSNARGGDTHIWTMDPDGSSQKLLLTRRGDRPAWSPDGTELAFSRISRHLSTITIVGANGSHARTLTFAGNRDIANPRWSPDGRQFVVDGFDFNVNDGGHDAFRIMIMNSDDGDITFVAPVPFPHKRMSGPTWSPRGDRIAFQVAKADDSQASEVFTMTPEGKDFRRLTHNGADEFDPDWSPDGSQLVYVRTRQHRFSHNRIQSDIAVMGKNGHDVSVLTHTERNEGSAAFSPNGKRIVFDRCCYGESKTSEIFVMHADGTHVMRLTHNEVWDTAPDWQPIPTGR
jgi:Tol biopolymer transport system component